MSKIYKILMCLALSFLCILPVFAEELPSDPAELVTESEENTDVLDVQEINQIIEYELQLNQPIKVFPITEEDYYQSENAARYVSGSAYQGSFNSTALNYFTGVMMNNIGKDYVAFRGSQYVYYLFFGDDISYSNGRFSGSGLDYVSYSSYEGTFERGVDSLSIADNNTVVYSNVDDTFANLVEVKTIEETRSQGIITASIFLLLCILWFFKR